MSQHTAAYDVANVLLYLGPLVSKLQQQYLERLGRPLTLRQYRTLAAIGTGHDTFTSLREVLVGSPGTISTAIESLESCELISRVASPDDQRWKIITLTESGESALRAAEEALADTQRLMAEHLPQVTAATHEDLRRLYEYLHTHFNK